MGGFRPVVYVSLCLLVSASILNGVAMLSTHWKHVPSTGSHVGLWELCSDSESCHVIDSRDCMVDVTVDDVSSDHERVPVTQHCDAFLATRAFSVLATVLSVAVFLLGVVAVMKEHLDLKKYVYVVGGLAGAVLWFVVLCGNKRRGERGAEEEVCVCVYVYVCCAVVRCAVVCGAVLCCALFGCRCITSVCVTGISGLLATSIFAAKFEEGAALAPGETYGFSFVLLLCAWVLQLAVALPLFEFAGLDYRALN